MTESPVETAGRFLDGASVSPEEMHARFAIPLEEFASFRDITRIYPSGEIVINEGDHERALYLLRVGTVEVFKGSGAAKDFIGTIEAVNFFGEMSMINDEPRSATVISRSESVVVYRIPNPSIHTILTNPLWAELLISRLAKNLASSAAQHLLLLEQVRQLRAEVERLKAERR